MGVLEASRLQRMALPVRAEKTSRAGTLVPSIGMKGRMAITTILFFWVLSAAPAIVLSAPAIGLGWQRVRWYWWEMFAFILPVSTWFMAMCLWQEHYNEPHGIAFSNKGVGNVFIEPVLLGLCVPIAALIRILLGKGRALEQRGVAVATLLGLSLVGLLIFFAVPYLHGTM